MGATFKISLGFYQEVALGTDNPKNIRGKRGGILKRRKEKYVCKIYVQHLRDPSNISIHLMHIGLTRLSSELACAL